MTVMIMIVAVMVAVAVGGSGSGSGNDCAHAVTSALAPDTGVERWHSPRCLSAKEGGVNEVKEVK